MAVRAGKAQLRALIGEVLEGRYEVQSLLGEGGMGTVFAGVQTSLDRPVAIKVLRPEMTTSEEIVKRFTREAKLTARLSHPHTIKLFDFGQSDDGLVYLVMELLEGSELFSVLRERGPLPVPRALRIAWQVARALRAGHRLGIVHRDLKPSNVRITEDDGGQDHAIVLDFGFAKKLDESVSQRLTIAGTLLGTPAYMSPEQAAGKPVSHASDIYALGVVLFEMLTGRVPFADKSMFNILMMHKTQLPPPLAEVRQELASYTELQALVYSLLDKDPKARPGADDLVERLAALMRDVASITAAAPYRVSVGSAEDNEATAFAHAIDDPAPEGDGPTAVGLQARAAAARLRVQSERRHAKSDVFSATVAAEEGATEVRNGARPKKPDSATHGRMPRSRAEVNRDFASISQGGGATDTPDGSGSRPDSSVGSAAERPASGVVTNVPRKPVIWPWIGLGVSALLVAVGVGFALWSGGDDAAPAATPPSNAASPAPKHVAVLAPDTPRPDATARSGADASAAARASAPAETDAGEGQRADVPEPEQKPPPAQAAEAADPVEKGHIRLTSIPTGAAVYLNRKKAGATPMTLKIPQRKRRSRIAMRKRGYKTWGLWIKRDHSEPVTAELVSRRKR